MHPDIEELLYKAEEEYLQTPEIELFKHHVASLAQRLETYECLRDQEIAIFQTVADRLLEAFPQENPQLLERALKHWLSVLRYCAMAMLLNNPEFLERRLLEWLGDLVQAHQMESLETKLCQLLLSRLKEVLSEQQLALVQPFLEQAQTTLLGDNALIQVGED
ncbi:MAG: phycobilisome protein [Xenococcaceae cyanobacterium]